MEAVFIFGCPRSGSTAVTELFKLSSDADVHLEQAPKLLEETRKHYEGRLENAESVMWDSRKENISASVREGKVYVDKNPCYQAFISNLVELWECRLLFLVRDGRESVRSMLDWNRYHSPSIFCLEEDWPPGSDEVASKEEQSQWDYSRPRPRQGDLLGSDWKLMSRFAKCSWYWNEFNLRASEALSRVDKKKWRLVNMNELDVEGAKDIFRFCELSLPSDEEIRPLLSRRINSASERFRVEDEFPKYPDWDEEMRQEFMRYAGEGMKTFGYAQGQG